MATQTKKAAIIQAKELVTTTKGKIHAVRDQAAVAEPELRQAVDDVDEALNTVRDLVKRIEDDAGLSATVSRFIRRMLSREFIIVVVSVVAILTGELTTEQVIGVAIAGSGLALGRSVAKVKTGGSDG